MYQTLREGESFPFFPSHSSTNLPDKNTRAFHEFCICQQTLRGSPRGSIWCPQTKKAKIIPPLIPIRKTWNVLSLVFRSYLFRNFGVWMVWSWGSSHTSKPKVFGSIGFSPPSEEWRVWCKIPAFWTAMVVFSLGPKSLPALSHVISLISWFVAATHRIHVWYSDPTCNCRFL